MQMIDPGDDHIDEGADMMDIVSSVYRGLDWGAYVDERQQFEDDNRSEGE